MTTFFKFDFRRHLPTKKNRNLWNLEKEINKSLDNLIQNRIEKCTNHVILDNMCPNGLLKVMIEARIEEGNKTISISDIVEECKTFFFAGKHTTSTLMTWMAILLAAHPSWQDMAREEVIRVCGEKNNTLSKDEVARLKVVRFIN